MTGTIPPMDEATAREIADAEAYLGELATALFAELPDWAQITWVDDGDASAASGLDERALAEKRVADAEKRFRTLVEQIPAVTFMAVLGHGKNEVYVSPHIEHMLGYTQAEWLENPFLWFWRLHPDDRTLWNDEFARGCRTGGPFRAECRFLARDGRTVWVHGEARLVKDELGRPQFLQGVAFDITESKRAQEVLLNEAVRSAKAEEELAIARRVQTAILPVNLSVEGLQIAAKMVPASEVGGDYYDVLPFQGGAWLGIGDVSGHGLNAGLVMLMVQSATAALVNTQSETSPRRLLLMLNQVLFDNVRRRLGGDDHVTCTLMRYTSDGTVTFAGAHEDILVYRAKTREVEEVMTPGTWIGARYDIANVTVDSSLKLEPGDVMLLYTDGVTEAMNGKGAMFDLHRLKESLAKHGECAVAVLRDRIHEDVCRWMAEQVDDITLVVVRYVGP